MNFCQAAITIGVSIFLALAAISTTTHQKNHASHTTADPPPPLRLRPDPSFRHRLVANATAVLRRSGFSVAASVLHNRFPTTTYTTLFAIHDSAINATSLPSWILRDLFRYHTSPSLLPLPNLLFRLTGSCIPTLLPGKNLLLTTVDPLLQLVEINGVRVSHPGLFLSPLLILHGVGSPFYAMDADDFRRIENFVPSPVCGLTFSQNRVPWRRIQKLLSVNGYISFAVALRAVLDGILADFPDLRTVTIFAPPDSEFAYVSSPSVLLEIIVRLHIIPSRVTYAELSTMNVGAEMETLVSGTKLVLTASGDERQPTTVNGMEVREPDLFAATAFAVHGISRPFGTMEPFDYAFPG